MLFSYLLLGLVLSAVIALLGFGGQNALAVGFGTPLAVYFLEVSVRGIAAWIKHRRLNYQLVDLGAFLFVVGLYYVVTEFEYKMEVPMVIVSLVVYLPIVFWASKRFPMAPRSDLGNSMPIPPLPLLWSRHIRPAKQDSVID
jgi:hypothetical protein